MTLGYEVAAAVRPAAYQIILGSKRRSCTARKTLDILTRLSLAKSKVKPQPVVGKALRNVFSI